MLDKIDGLANKGIKILVLVVFAIVVYAAVSSSFDGVPGLVKDTKTDLFVGYRENIYETAKCDVRQVSGAWVILCHPDGQLAGGLFEVDVDSGFLYALNGKAQTHAERIGVGVKVKRDGGVDPSEALKLFEPDVDS